MASIERRLESLEAAFAEARGEEAGELARRLFREAYRRLSIVEMHVMGELREAYGARLGASPAQVWHDLTEAQRSMQYRWLDVVRDTARHLADTSEDLDAAQRKELRELARDVGNYPFFEEGGR